MAGTEVEVVGVGQQDRNAEIFGQIALGEPFDRGLGADRHEDRCFDGPVRRMQQSRAGTGVGAFGNDFKGDLGQRRAYVPMIADHGAGGRFGGCCDAISESRDKSCDDNKWFICFILQGLSEILLRNSLRGAGLAKQRPGEDRLRRGTPPAGFGSWCISRFEISTPTAPIQTLGTLSR